MVVVCNNLLGFSSMSHSKIFKSYSSSYMSREDLFNTDDGGRGDVWPSITLFFSHKVGFSENGMMKAFNNIIIIVQH